jgi:hypothetical protein
MVTFTPRIVVEDRAMFESLRNSGWKGVAVLVGAAALAPTVWPAVGRAARPAAKSALKAGLVTAEQARERWAELSEAADDLWAEVRHELDEERRDRAAAETTTAPATDQPADATHPDASAAEADEPARRPASDAA